MAEADRIKAEKVLRDEQREFSRKGGEFQDDLRRGVMRKSARFSATWCKKFNLLECPGLRFGAGRMPLYQAVAGYHGADFGRPEDQAGHLAGHLRARAPSGAPAKPPGAK